MSGGRGNQEPTYKRQEVVPWSGVQPFLRDVFQRLNELYSQGAPEYFPGQTVAPLGPDITAGVQKMRDAAGQQEQLLQDTLGRLQVATNPDVGNDPYLAGAVQGAIRPVMRQLNEVILPRIDSEAVAAGGYGGARQGIAQGIAARGAVDAIADRTFAAYSNALQRNLDRVLKSTFALPQLIAGTQAPAQTLIGAGNIMRSFEQALLDEARARYEYNATKDLDYQRQFLQDLLGVPMGQEATTNADAMRRPSTLNRVLGGAAAGYASTGNWWGAAAGALAGLFL